MKLILTFEGKDETMKLSLHHNHYIQAAIYQLLDPVYATFLHQEGYIFNNRQFRLFSFSRLMGNYSVDSKAGVISYTGPVKLVVLSPIQNISEEIVNSLIRGKEFRIGTQQLSCVAVQAEYPSVTSREIKVRTLSPIVSYSTMLRPDGRKFTYYYEPAETEFVRLVCENLFKKYRAWELNPEIAEADFDFTIEPLGRYRRRILKYKDIIIKGYSGNYLLRGKEEYLNYALNVGLGAKGPQGFGVIELV